MNSVELILLKCIPRGHPNLCSRVGLSCSIFKNTSATCAYPLVSNARKLKRDKRAHACAQGTFSYTPCSRRGLTKNIRKHIFFVRHLLVHAMFEKGPYEKFVYKIPYRRARAWHSAFRPSASREQRYLAYKRKIYAFPQIYTFNKTYVFWKSIYVFKKSIYVFWKSMYVF